MARETDVSPEARLLIALAKPHLADADRRRGAAALSDPAFSWADALRLGAVHGVQAMLAWNLKAPDAEAFARLPHSVRLELGAALLAARTRRLHYHAVVSPVLDKLNAHGIPFALMKGAVVTETVYPDDTRWLNDLDVLVPVTARSAAVEAFVRGGFRLASELPEPDTYHQVMLTWPGGGPAPPCVDLHWDINAPDHPFTFDVSEVLNRARPMRFGDAQALGMSPEDTLAHYATQLFTDFFRASLGRFCDIYGLLQLASPRRLLDAACESRAAGITHTALHTLSLLGATVPADLLDALARECPRCTLGSEVLADHRWLFGNKRLSWGAMAIVTARYLPSATQRRDYWRSLPRGLYRDKRSDRSSMGASLDVARALCAVLAYGGLVQLLTRIDRPPRTANGKLRDLLWREA